VFRRIAYPATATATIDSVVLAWTAAQFERLLRCYPQLAANALAVVGGRAEQMLQRLREFTTETVEQRIARILVRFAKQSGSKPDRQRELVLKISRQDLAELSDTTMFTASRVISAWSRAGIVEGGRGSIRLVDLKRLSQIAAPKTASYER
jgi:CRP/FNR family transcriptional regulator, nitrogen oxide reductase regulator